VRAVVDVNVLISAVLSARHSSAQKAAAFVGWVREHGTLAEDPSEPAPIRSPDPDDDYLLALAIDQRAFLVTGDRDLLGPRQDLPILAPAEFVTKLRETA
jgi:predicted nucleic acid-binding protein